MRIKESIEMQDKFESPRGINHSPQSAFTRFMDEVEELYWELASNDDIRALEELTDVFIMASAIAKALCHNTGTTPEEFEQMIDKKYQHNEQKYGEEFFRNGWEPEDALRVAKHWYNMGLHDGSWHEEEDF